MNTYPRTLADSLTVAELVVKMTMEQHRQKFEKVNAISRNDAKNCIKNVASRMTAVSLETNH